jgi:spore coat protein X
VKEGKLWAGDAPDVKCEDLDKKKDKKRDDKKDKKGDDKKDKKRWDALDPFSAHPLDKDTQDLSAAIETIQHSYEQIIVLDSADVEITTTDTQAAISLQAALQAAIALVISISIADSQKAEKLTQELLGRLKTSQVNRQQTYVENSRGVKITTTDTDAVVNVQLLLQVLVVLLARIDVL